MPSLCALQHFAEPRPGFEIPTARVFVVVDAPGIAIAFFPRRRTRIAQQEKDWDRAATAVPMNPGSGKICN